MSFITAVSDGKKFSYTKQTEGQINIKNGVCCEDGSFYTNNFSRIKLNGSIFIDTDGKETIKYWYKLKGARF